MGYFVLYITHRLSIYLNLKYKKKLNVHLIKKYNNDICDINIKETKEYLADTLDYNDAIVLYNSIYKTLNDIKVNINLSYIFIWNGCDILGKAATQWACTNYVQCVFFEISNLPGKIFVDPFGVNAKSILAKNIKILDSFDLKWNDYIYWRNEYFLYLKNDNLLPQAKNLKKVNYGSLIDRLASFFFTPKYEKISIISKLYNKLRIKNNIYHYDTFNKTGNNYIFVPLQVASDSQVLINSDYNIYDLIDYAIEQSHKFSLDLVIKPHPAEPNADNVTKVMSYSYMYPNLYIVNENIYDLILNSEYVITINSTVGLQALILNKKVDILGKTYYNFFNNIRLAKFVINWLIDIDYFNDNQYIDFSEINKIFQIVKMKSYFKDTKMLSE
jgi:capsular polysaccharide export protein